jgi:hypothetical protein
MGRSTCLTVLALLLLAGPALCDTLSTRRAKDEKVFRFGSTVIRQTYDSRRDPGSPEITLQLYVGDQLKVQLNHAAFSQYFSSPDNELIVGLSNSGWPGSAAIVFDKDGRILLWSDHLSARFDYCFETSTFGREWYDAKDPQVRFPAGHAFTRIYGITLKSCRGSTIGLVESVNGAADQHYRRLQDFEKPELAPVKRKQNGGVLR